MARDVGSYFEKLTRKGSGGRRLDAGSTDRRSTRSTTDSSSTTEPAPTSGRPGGGIADMLKDVLARGRDGVTATTKKTAERVRSRTTRRRPPPRGRALPAEGIVKVEYSPRLDGDPDPGEVVWAWVPFEEDPSQGKDRPLVVIGRRRGRLVGVPLTTKRSDREAQIAIGSGGWDPKRRQSYARIWRMIDFDEHRMRREGSILERARFDQVIAAVDEYYDVSVPVATNESAARRGRDDNFDFDY